MGVVVVAVHGPGGCGVWGDGIGAAQELVGAEEQVGLYINMLPLRSKVKAEMEVVDWLEELQRGHSGSREYQYGSLREVQQRYTGIWGTGLTALRLLENYPLSDLLRQVRRSG